MPLSVLFTTRFLLEARLLDRFPLRPSRESDTLALHSERLVYLSYTHSLDFLTQISLLDMENMDLFSQSVRVLVHLLARLQHDNSWPN